MAPLSLIESDLPESDGVGGSGSRSNGGSTGKATHGSECLEYGADETMIVMEWDDLLFPTSWLHFVGLLSHEDHRAPETEEQVEELKRIEDAVGDLLLQAKRKSSRVAILSTGHEGWIPLSCEWFMPSVAPILHETFLIYTLKERASPMVASYCKMGSFSDFILQYFREMRLSTESRMNILSLEAGPPFALDLLAGGTEPFSDVLRKTVAFPVNPSGPRLREELELLVPQFTGLIECNYSWNGDGTFLR